MNRSDKLFVLKMSIKYAEAPSPYDEPKNTFPLTLKNQVTPWIKSSIKLLDDTIPLLTPQLLADKTHIYNIYNQISPSIKISAEDVKSKFEKLITNMDIYTPEKMLEVVNLIKATIAGNPMYKTNPFFQLKANTKYSVDDCTRYLDRVCLEFIKQSPKTKPV